MFGLVQPCRHQLDGPLLDQWRAHLCGLCLALRDGSGQLSRVTTNTDAVMISVLVEAQAGATRSRRTAGPCPLRAMRTASVVSPDSMGPRLGATASLTLAAAKAADYVQEQEFRLAGSAPMRGRMAGTISESLRRKALRDRQVAQVLEVDDLLSGLAGQGEIEILVRTGDSLAAVTAPAAAAAGAIFAGSSALAGTPGNASELRQMGEAFGELAHLVDAVVDLTEDERRGDFNPILASGTPLPVVRRRAFALTRRVREGVDRIELRDAALLRVLLVDVLHRSVHQAFDPAPDTAGTDPGQVRVSLPGHDFSRPRRRSFPAKILPWIGTYCTGYALCAEHENPCTGKRHPAGCNNCDSCDCCDCCGCDCC